MNSDSENLKKRFKRTNSLIRKKYLEYVPVLFITNLSSLLLITIDGIFVGNYIGSEALAAVDMFTPIAVLISAYIALSAHGIADSFADALIGNDPMEKQYNAKAIKFVVVVSVIILAFIQAPITRFILHLYDPAPELYFMARAYAIAVLISMPFKLISTVGACQFQEIGRMNVLMYISIIEGVVNIILNFVFVVALKMGVRGAGMATAIAVIVGSVLTATYFLTKTNIYKRHKVKLRMEDVKKIIVVGAPYSIGILTSAIHAFLMLKIIFYAFGESGAEVDGVCNFCLSVATVFIASCGDANGPLNGIFLSIGDRIAVRDALRISIRQIIVSVGAFTVFIFLKPELFYHINGVNNIPSFGINALKIYALCLIAWGINSLFAGYFIDIDEVKITARLTIIGDLLTPVVAILFLYFVGKVHLWFAELVVASLVLLIYLIRYLIDYFKEEKEEEKDSDILYLEVEPNEGVEASKELYEYAIANNHPKDVSNDVAVCMEKMVDYAVKSHDSQDIHIQIMIRFKGGGAKFIMFDDGERLHFHGKNEPDKVLSENFELVKKMAKSYKYQYVLNMNYITFEF